MAFLYHQAQLHGVVDNRASTPVPADIAGAYLKLKLLTNLEEQLDSSLQAMFADFRSQGQRGATAGAQRREAGHA